MDIHLSGRYYLAIYLFIYILRMFSYTAIEGARMESSESMDPIHTRLALKTEPFQSFVSKAILKRTSRFLR